MDLYIELPRPPPQTFICAFGPPLSCLFPMQKSSSTLLQIQESLSRVPQAAAQAINPYARACRLPLSSKCRSPFSKRSNPYVELPMPPPQTFVRACGSPLCCLLHMQVFLHKAPQVTAFLPPPNAGILCPNTGIPPPPQAIYPYACACVPPLSCKCKNPFSKCRNR